MGLDMYLTKEIYIGAKYKHRDIKGKIELTTCGQEIKIDINKISCISESSGYWRKANAIHQWFVDNVQDGEDNCQRSWVSKEKLERLRNECKEVLRDKSKASEVLPTSSGFFFGDTEYNEYYFKYLEDTIEILDNCLSGESGDYFYEASW